MADTKTTALTANTTPISTDLVYMIDDPSGTAASQKMTLATLMQMATSANEIKGWPPIVNTGDLDALNLWWDKVGTPTTAPSVVAVSGEAGITETWELAIKVVTDAASEGMSQTWTYADEPRVKSGRVMSALLAIWSVSAVSVTAKLVNSDASTTSASAVTAAAWTIVEIPNHTLAGTSCQLTVTAAAAGTFYVVPLGANMGSTGLRLKPRGLRYVNVPADGVYNADPGGAAAGYVDLDLTASTSPLAAMVQLLVGYYNSSAAGHSVRLRRNGDTSDLNAHAAAGAPGTEGGNWHWNNAIRAMDDGQIIEHKSSAGAGDTEGVYISVIGWWEWE